MANIYLHFTELMYWRMSAKTPNTNEYVDEDYPKRYHTWKGIPTEIDAAFTGIDINTGNYLYSSVHRRC